ncbi:MAG: amidohydrolase family protein [Actinobacteria bacterium]|nr:amidohydrolase family protein [Actinomycetota bacterium]
MDGGREPELAVTARLALPCDGREPILDAMVVIRSGRIAAVGCRAELEPSLDARRAERVDFGDALILPGLVNAHCHLEYTAFGPLEGGRPFVDWIGDAVAWSRRTSPDQRRKSARAGAQLILRSGVTCVGDVVSRGQGLDAMLEYGLHGIAYIEFGRPRSFRTVDQQL